MIGIQWRSIASLYHCSGKAYCVFSLSQMRLVLEISQFFRNTKSISVGERSSSTLLANDILKSVMPVYTENLPCILTLYFLPRLEDMNQTS